MLVTHRLPNSIDAVSPYSVYLHMLGGCCYSAAARSVNTNCLPMPASQPASQPAVDAVDLGGRVYMTAAASAAACNRI
jgi:hypothetical protein